jgi:hypothetical protein
METNTTVLAVIGIIFFVLALVAIFRFDKVKNTFEGLGFKFDITGSRENKGKKTRQSSSTDIDEEPAPSGKSSIKVGGSVSDSELFSKGSSESTVDVEKDVKKSKLRSEGGRSNKR